MSGSTHPGSSVVKTSSEDSHLPTVVRRFVARSLPEDGALPAVVRVRQEGEMWKKPGARAMRFEAVEDFLVDRVGFSWRARFRLVGPLALSVCDELDQAGGRLRVSLLGIPLQTERGPETTVGQAMRYLAELAWAPQAIAANRELEWRVLDDSTVEVTGCGAKVRWDFDEVGDLVHVAGVRPLREGRAFVPRQWGGAFGEYASFAGARVPTFGEVWWELPEGRFTYWRGRVTSLELRGSG